MGNHSNSDLIASYRDLAPRLAAWAQQVMPLVEAAEEYKKAITDETCSTYQRMVARDGFVAAALALNLEVPT